LLVGRDTSAGRDGWDKHHGWKVIEKKWSDGWSVIVWGESESWWAFPLLISGYNNVLRKKSFIVSFV
jgi:hypothetical protein